MLNFQIRLSLRLKQKEEECTALHSIEENQQYQINSTTQNIQHLQSEINLLSKRLQQSEETYKQTKENNEESLLIITRLNEHNQKLEKEISIFKEMELKIRMESNQNETDNENLKRQIDQLNKKILFQKDENMKLLSDRKALEDRIQELRVLITSLETMNRTQADRSTKLVYTIDEENEKYHQLLKENNYYKDLSNQKDSRIMELEESLRVLDEDRDKIQLELDTLVENQFKFTKYINEEKENRNHIQSSYENLEKKLYQLQQDFNSSQRNITVLESRINALKEENSELRRTLSVKSSELSASSSDLQLMTRENQALTSELAHTTSDRNALRKQLRDMADKLTSLEEEYRYAN